MLAACGDDDDDATPAADHTGTRPTPSATSAADCAGGNTIDSGKLTIATGDPAFPPYVINDATPEDGQGFEAAVAMAVARELGFTGDAVTWVRTPFDAAIAPGPKNFDFNLQQYSITPERAQVVDFSEGVLHGTAGDLRAGRLPRRIGQDDRRPQGASRSASPPARRASPTSRTTIQPDQDPLIFNDNAAAKTALESNQIDAVVSDLPTAIYITTVEIEGTKVFGQIEGSGTDQWGLLLAKDSPLTSCVEPRAGDHEGLGRARPDHDEVDERLHRGARHLSLVTNVSQRVADPPRGVRASVNDCAGSSWPAPARRP